MDIKCQYTGTFQDPSGYGDANRNFIVALFIAGVDITTELVVQMSDKHSYGWIGSLCNNLKDRNINPKIKIIHLTPDMYPRYMESGKYHIGHLFWETDRLPKEWIVPCNKVNEIWTASPQQAEMIKNSGVKVPIYCFPQPVDIHLSSSSTPPFIIPNYSGLLFYSVFQWIERKNPKALLTTYWKTFTGKTDVALLLKTYRLNYSQSEFDKIKDDIRQWKLELNLPHYPKVFLAKKLLTTEQMFRLHSTGTAFVTTSRGEGFQRPAVEAMLMGKPVISCDKTGFADLLPQDKFYPCKCEYDEVIPVSWIPWYTSDQKWLEINKEDLSNQMLSIYNNREKAMSIGKEAQTFVTDNFNYWKVGQDMKARLEKISKFI